MKFIRKIKLSKLFFGIVFLYCLFLLARELYLTLFYDFCGVGNFHKLTVLEELKIDQEFETIPFRYTGYEYTHLKMILPISIFIFIISIILETKKIIKNKKRFNLSLILILILVISINFWISKQSLYPIFIRPIPYFLISGFLFYWS